MWVANAILTVFSIVLLIGIFFLFDDAILRGYFATKLRKRFDVESLK